MPIFLHFILAGWRSDRLGIRARWWLFWAIIGFGVVAATAWQYRIDIFQFLLAPANGSLSPFDGGLPVFTSPTDMWWLTVGFVMRAGLVGALPIFSLGVYVLAWPLLSPQFRRFLLLVAFSGLLFMAGGLAFVYYVMLPAALGFLLHFGDEVAVALIGIKAYFDLLFSLMFWVSVVFELPLLMYLLTKMRFVKYRQFKRVRKFVPFAALILGAIITPTADPVNQILIAVPIILLYEVGLFLSWLARPTEGNYLWLKTIRSGILWVKHLPCRAARKALRLATAPFRKLWRG